MNNMKEKSKKALWVVTCISHPNPCDAKQWPCMVIRGSKSFADKTVSELNSEGAGELYEYRECQTSVIVEERNQIAPTMNIPILNNSEKTKWYQFRRKRAVAESRRNNLSKSVRALLEIERGSGFKIELKPDLGAGQRFVVYVEGKD